MRSARWTDPPTASLWRSLVSIHPDSRRFRPRGVSLVNLCCHDEIALGQTVNGVRPESDFCLTPRKKNVRMVPLLLRNLAYPVHKSERLAEIRKLEGLAKMMFAHDAPAIDL